MNKYEFVGIKEFYEGLAIVRYHGKYGYINKSGTVIIDFTFDYAKRFSAGLASVKKDGKWGYIDNTGKIVIEFQLDEADIFLSDRASVIKSGDKGFINRNGDFITDTEYYIKKQSISDYQEGMALIYHEDERLFGYIDEYRKLVIPFQFDDAKNFTDSNRAAVRKEGKWGYIDKTGKIVIKYQFEEADDFLEVIIIEEDQIIPLYGMDGVTLSDCYEANVIKDGERGCINLDGVFTKYQDTN